MRVYRYPLRSLVGDYIRAAGGMALGYGVLASVPPSLPIVGIFGGIAGLFTYFGVRTLRRHLTKVGVSPEEIYDVAFTTRSIPWERLERLNIRFYGTRRQLANNARSGGLSVRGGFMQLTLAGPGARMSYESSLEGFNYIAWRAAKAAREKQLSIDPTSAGNLLALGIDIDRETEPPGEIGGADD